ncbi:MFS transporter [Naumannella halotolerans]|uniref:Putative MFS family arabinose efflux permease n=1 Tax=Naumannella halotolerans TaxID=993414 RepID=A0A4R7JAV6_9ACTN|nr:MFS transporter [Naumannella halotolerans]TDT34056.1 putative MFS family arabinose efflux permease [Naumannella halotolerans]
MSQPSIGLARLAFSTYAPTLVSTIGLGAVYPLIALTARDLGASVGTAAFIVALLGVGQLLGDLPAGQLASRFGEKWALVGACVIDAVAFCVAWQAPNVGVLGAAVLVAGMSAAVFGLARQAYLTDAIPSHQRARAMSTLGGVFRIGMFIGPLIGAFVVTHFGLQEAYLLAAATSLLAAVMNLSLPPLPERTDQAVAGQRLGFWRLLSDHRKVFATLGVGALLIMMARAARLSLVPLWAESQGIDAATTSIIFGISAAADMLLFYPGGMIMDRFGRFWVGVPAMVVIGAGLVLLALTHDPVTVGVVAVLIGLGNGISAGIVLTLGADHAPVAGRPKFLALWRLFADGGNALGPLLVSAVVAVAPLAAAVVVMGGLTLAGAGWLARWLPVAPRLRRLDPGDR